MFKKIFKALSLTFGVFPTLYSTHLTGQLSRYIPPTKNATTATSSMYLHL